MADCAMVIMMYATGMTTSAIGAVVAFLDLKGMGTGHVKTDERVRVVCAGVIAGFTLIAYWTVAVIGIARYI